MSDVADLCCGGEGGAGVHPGPVPGHLVGGAGGVSCHVGGADGRPHGGPTAPAGNTARGPQVGLDVCVAVHLLALDFTGGELGVNRCC